MNKELRYTAELVMLYSVPINTGAKSNGRLAKLQLRVQEIVDKSLKGRLEVLPEWNSILISHVMQKWGEDTGWNKKNKNIGTLACFCAQMIDVSPYRKRFDPEIALLLGDIIDHLGKKVYPLSVYSGQVASDKWCKLMT